MAWNFFTRESALARRARQVSQIQLTSCQLPKRPKRQKILSFLSLPFSTSHINWWKRQDSNAFQFEVRGIWPFLSTCCLQWDFVFLVRGHHVAENSANCPCYIQLCGWFWFVLYFLRKRRLTSFRCRIGCSMKTSLWQDIEGILFFFLLLLFSLRFTSPST